MNILNKNVAGYEAEWSTWTKRVAIIGLIIFLIYSTTLLGTVFTNLLISLILAFVLFIPIRFIYIHTPLNYGFSILVVFMVYMACSFMLLSGFTAPVSSFFSTITTEVERVIPEAVTFLQNYDRNNAANSELQIGSGTLNISFILEPLSESVKNGNTEQITDTILNFIGINQGEVISRISSTFSTLISFLSNFIIVHLLAILFLIEIPRAYLWLKTSLPDKFRREYAILLSKTNRIWSKYLFGQFIIALIIGGFTWFQFSLMGIPSGLVVAFITIVLSLIPILGGFISLIPISLIPLIQGSSFLEFDNASLTILVVLINVIFQQIVWNILSPKISGDAVDLPMPLIILGLFIGTALGGVVGALIAAPFMGIVRILVEYIIKKINGGDPFPNVPEPYFMRHGLFEPKNKFTWFSDLRERLFKNV